MGRWRYAGANWENMELELDGKVILVTGGSDGVGAAVARILAGERARVCICARNVQRLEAFADELRAGGGDILAVRADVTDYEQLVEFVSKAHDCWGRVDGLVNNAGEALSGPFLDLTDNVWHDDLELKLLAAIRLCRLVYPAMKESGGGSIVNVINIAAKAPPASSMPTAVSRAAGMALTKALSKEWATDAIRVNAINIGIVASGQWRRWAVERGISEDEIYEQTAARRSIPLGRVGRAEEVGDLVAFLMSKRGGYITGASINVDGGLSPVV